MKRMCLRIVAIAALLGISSACSTAPSIEPAAFIAEQATTVPPTAQPLDFPRGRFSDGVAPTTIVLEIEADGRYRVYRDLESVDSGTFLIDGEQVLVDSLACARRGEKPAAYSWVYDDENGLAFQPVAVDPCPERRQYLAEEYEPSMLFIFELPDTGLRGRTA